MDDTSCGDKCPFVLMGACKDCTTCPNYVESWWTQQGATVPKLVKDCSPKRLMLQQQYLQLRLEQQSADLAEARLQYVQVAEHLKQILDLAKPLELEKQNESKSPYTLNLPGDSTVLHAD